MKLKSAELREKFASLKATTIIANNITDNLLDQIKEILKFTNHAFEADPYGVRHTITDLNEDDEVEESPAIKVLNEIWYDNIQGKLICKCVDGTTTDNFIINDIPYLADELVELEKDCWVEEAEENDRKAKIFG